MGERTHSELKEKKRLYTIRVQLKAGRRRVSCADPSLLDISVLDVWFRRGTAGSVPSADRRVYGCSFCDWFGAFGVCGLAVGQSQEGAEACVPSGSALLDTVVQA